MTSSEPASTSAGPVKGFLFASWATTALLVVQLVLGIVVLSNDSSPAAHGGVGYVTLVAAIVAAYFGWQLSQTDGNKGLFYHAVSMPILMIVQIGLGSMGVKWVHVVLGFLIVIGVIGMAVRATVLNKRA